MTPPSIRTVTVPDSDLLEALQPAPAGINLVVWDFKQAPVGADLEDVDVAVLPYMQRGDLSDQLQSAPALKLVQTQSTGYEGVPEMAGDGVAVCSAAGVHAAATAEMAVGLAIASLRGIDVAVLNQREGRWSPARFPGLADRRVLLLGVGGIGEEIAKRLDPFEVDLTRVGSTARTDERGRVHGSDELVDLAGRHDVLIIITPLSDSTRGLVGREVLAALPDGALVVNVARGAVVDSEALTAEVVSGRLRAAVDVFDPEPIPAGHPLWGAENAIITPHNGGNTGAFWPRIVRLLRRQLEALAEGREPANLVVPGLWASVREER
jgi:phosphoglycerate dehydrogenase-like enzyme